MKLSKSAIVNLQTELDTQEFQINAPIDSQKEPLTNPFDIVYPAEHLEDNTTITCKIAIQIKCHDGRRYILVPDGNAIVLPNSDQQSTQVKTHQSNAILQAVAEVHAWKEQFMRGDLTTKQLADW